MSELGPELEENTHLIESEPIEDQEREYTTNKEIFGWCLYNWATEPFIVSAVSTYVPLLLDLFARENGVLANDHSRSCKFNDDKPLNPVPQPPPPAELVARSLLFIRDATTQSRKSACVVNVFGIYMDPSSFSLYVFSLSVLLQTIVVVSITGFADKGNFKKPLLIAFGLLGSFFTRAFYTLESTNYYSAGVVCILANICYGVVSVCGNSFLPTLVENYKLSPSSEQTELEQKATISSKISGLCSGLGYIAALIVQICTMVIVLKTGSKMLSIQYAILFVSYWWLFFQLPIIWLLKVRRHPESIDLLNKFKKSSLNYKRSSNTVKEIILESLLHKTFYFKEYIKMGWVNLFAAFGQIRLLKDVCFFLIGWFLISDSITTINSAAILFSKTELNMKAHELAIIGILSIIFAVAGTIVIPYGLNTYLKISLPKTLSIVILWSSVIPLYGILGFFTTSFGLKHKSEMYLLSCWYGLSLGGLSTISRSLFGLLVPKGKESLFFALFAITDKGSSVLGPLVVGLITDKTHNIRYCFWFLFGTLILSLPVFHQLNLERGQKEAEMFDEIVDPDFLPLLDN